MSRIEKLSAEQQAAMPGWVDRWVAAGLSCDPADRPAFERAVAGLYEGTGLDPAPVIWVTNPLVGALGNGMLAQVGDQVGDQVEDQVRDQVEAQVWAQVRAQVRDQVEAQVEAQVRGQVWAQVRAQVEAQVGDQVEAQVRAQVGDQVRDQVRDQVEAQVWAQVRAQVGDQVEAQVGDQVGDQVWDQVRGQVRDQVWDQVGDQVRDQVRDQVGAQWHRGLVYGEWSVYWSAWQTFLRHVGVSLAAGLAARADALADTATTGGWWWAWQGLVIACERHDRLTRDNSGRLHNEQGPAAGWADGWEFWCWHGLRVPRWVVETPTVEAIQAEPNTEIRRAAIESYGWDRWISHLGLTPIDVAADPGNPGHMLELFELPDDQQPFDVRVRLLLMHNASLDRDGSRRRFAETVPADMPDALSAAAWQWGDDMTPDLYKTMQRAT